MALRPAMTHQQHCPLPNAMLYGEQGTTIHIHDGNFTQNNHPQPQQCNSHIDGTLLTSPSSEKNYTDCDYLSLIDVFKRIQSHVAMSAFDSVEQVDAPKCHPNTREAVQNDIMEWIMQTSDRIQWMLWLNGAAGAGKTAIARSIVALCLSRNIPIARFFFSRTDSRRNSLQPIVATLLYQLIEQLPDLLEIVAPKIKFDPLIFKKSLETQLRYLVFEPLKLLHREKILNNVVLMFDGVDECNGHDNQTQLIRLISKFVNSHDLPIIAFFGSRAEHQLQQIFRSQDISTILHQLALDDRYLPDADIRLFLDDRFRQIKETHILSSHLENDWPDTAHIQEIVGKSSGQFIYASVVIDFVSSSRHHPALQLDIIRGLRPVENSLPFAQLDALYKHIFSQVNDFERTSFLLAWKIFVNSFPSEIGCFSPNEVSALLVDLASILKYEAGRITFRHASLPDFLLDQKRSEEYYFDKQLWCTKLSICCLRGGTGLNEGGA